MATLADRMAGDTQIPPKTFVITFDDGWADGYDYAFPVLRKYGYVGTYFVIGSRIGQKDFLTAGMMRALEDAGNDIGNHTEYHVRLATFKTPRVKAEIENASREIEAALGHRPVTLAYPMGSTSPYVESVAAGIPDLACAVTTSPGSSETWDQRFAMPRIRVNPTTNGHELVVSLSYS